MKKHLKNSELIHGHVPKNNIVKMPRMEYIYYYIIRTKGILIFFEKHNSLLLNTFIFCGCDSVVIPSSPLISTTQTTSTSITITWTQTIGDLVDSYTVSYSFTVIGCGGVSGSTGDHDIMGIDGSTRMYTLSGLEEYTEFTITLTAVNGAGSASVSRAVRTRVGNYILRA